MNDLFNKYFRKYIYKYAVFLFIGIAVLITIDYVQLRVPRIIGEVIDVLSDYRKDLAKIKLVEEKDGNLKYEVTKDSIYNDDENATLSFNVVIDLEGEIISYEVLTYNHSDGSYKEIAEEFFNSLLGLNINELNDDLLDGQTGATNSRTAILELLNDLAIHVEGNTEEVARVELLIKKSVQSLIIVVLIVAVGRVLWRLALFGTSRKIEYGLRNEMFNHATTLGQDYYSHQKVGGMMTYFINDLNAVRMAFGPGLMMLVDSIFLGAFAIIRMYTLNPNLTYIITIPIAALVVGMVIINRSMRAQFRIRQEKFRDLSDYTQEDFSGLSVIKAYVREAYEIITFKRLSQELYDSNMKFFKRSLWVQLITTIAINLVVVTIIGFGALAVVRTIGAANNGEFTVGSLTEFISLFSALTWPTMALARFLSLFSQAQASGQRIKEFLDTKPTVVDGDDLIEVEDLSPAIKVENLSFNYPDGEEKVLKDITFEIKSGEMVGILGKTGSGKTTLVDLMLRVYNVDENKIFLGGHDIMRLPIKKVRDTIGYVPQDNFLFSDTIKNNIGFSRDSFTDEEIIDSAKFADIYENVVDFKEGFQTVLGERGVTVSGGQKQRISIARALTKNPDILILDDSVSAVDTKTEETIINNLYKLRKNKTTILIAHRISTVKDLDKIIIIDEGEIVAIGSHKELMKKSPFYQEIVKRQTLEEKVMGGEYNV